MWKYRRGQEAVEAGLKEVEKPSVHFKNVNAEGAVDLFDLETGYRKAMIGGRISKRASLNGLPARRQTGSAFKPLVYASPWIRVHSGLCDVDAPGRF